MKTKKSLRLLSALLSVLMVLSVFSAVSVFATDDVTGSAGENCTFTLKETGEMIISGTGAIEYQSVSYPWTANKSDIRTLTIGEGITSIPAGAFADCYNLYEVNIGDDVTEIGASAFVNTGLHRVELSQYVSNVGEHAFGFTFDPDDNIFIKDTEFVICGPDLDCGAKEYANANGFEYEFTDNDYEEEEEEDKAYVSPSSITIKAGASKKVYFHDNGHGLELVKSKNKSIAKAVKKSSSAVIYGLKKGTTTVEFWDTNVTCCKLKVKVTTNPTIKVGGKKFKASKTYPVKKGKTLTVKISGKSSVVKNVYSSSKKSVAKVISKNTAKTVKIKGYKKGSAKVTIKVNGVAFKIKVKVKAK